MRGELLCRADSSDARQGIRPEQRRTPRSEERGLRIRAQILADESGELSTEDVIPNRASLLVFSRRGYIKRMPADLFAVQARHTCSGALSECIWDPGRLKTCNGTWHCSPEALQSLRSSACTHSNSHVCCSAPLREAQCACVACHSSAGTRFPRHLSVVHDAILTWCAPSQARGGRGKSGARLRNEDTVEEVAQVCKKKSDLPPATHPRRG